MRGESRLSLHVPPASQQTAVVKRPLVLRTGSTCRLSCPQLVVLLEGRRRVAVVKSPNGVHEFAVVLMSLLSPRLAAAAPSSLFRQTGVHFARREHRARNRCHPHSHAFTDYDDEQDEK